MTKTLHRHHRVCAAISAWSAAALFGVATSALGATGIAIMDQIGSATPGSSNAVHVSQFFEPSRSPTYDIASVDDFTAASNLLRLTQIDVLLGGSSNTNFSSVTAYSVEIWDTANPTSLTGNIVSLTLSPSQVTLDTSLGATRPLASLPLNVTLPRAGTYYIAVVPSNSLMDNGLVGVFDLSPTLSTPGGLNAFQVNPGGGFGSSPATISPGADLAYRLYAVPEPSTWALLAAGGAGLGLMVFSRRHRSSAQAARQSRA